MLKVDASLNHLPARREFVLALYESINQPLVNIPGFGAAPTGAYVLGTRNDQGSYTVFVYLHQRETRAVVIYVSEPRALTAEQYRTEEGEALRFVESMGFMVDNLHFSALPPSEQEAVIARVPLFRPPERALERLEGVEERFRAGPRSGRAEYDALFGSLGGEADPQRRLGPPEPRSAQPYGAAGYGPSPASAPVSRGGLAGSLSGRAGPNSGFGAPPGLPAPVPLSSPPSFTPRPLLSTVPSALPLDPPPEGFGARGGHERTPEPTMLERLGRLLGSFGVLFALGATLAAGCQAGGARDVARSASEAPLDSHIDLGNQQLVQGQFREAVATFNLVLEEDDKNRDALRGLGFAYLSLERLEEAEKFYRGSIASDPKWSLPKNELAVVLMARKQCPEAEKLLQEVLGDIFYATPEFAEHNLARALACQGRMAEALDILERLQTKRPQFCLGYLTLAELSAEARRPELTVNACERFTAHCEQHAEIQKQVTPEHSALCLLRKGRAYAELGDVESARSALQRCEATGRFVPDCRRSRELLPQ
jgi:Tfp pilus assembly protein PilF